MEEAKTIETGPEGKIGGGYIVLKRAKKGKAILLASPQPWEHADLDKARAEAQRLAEEHPGRQFVVFIADPMTFLVPKPEAPAVEEPANG